MAHGDNPADRYNHRAPRERPVGELPDAIRGVEVDSDDTQSGDIEHFDAATQQGARRRSLQGDGDDRAGAGGAPDHGVGDPGGTLGTQGRREQDK